jgi:hypothetical protein
MEKIIYTEIFYSLQGEYSQWFEGKMEVVRLYKSALSESEVLQNFNANRNLYGI